MTAELPREETPREKFVVPCEIAWFRDKPLVGFAEVSSDEIERAFWTQTLEKRRLVDLRPLDEIEPETASAQLSGMIYMMGRCGSTLLARQLSTLPGVYVLREPVLFFSLLDSGRGTVVERTRWLQHLVAAYGNALQGRVRHLVIKWSPFSVFFASDVIAAFPGAPAIFLYRDPVEVLVSFREHPVRMNEVFRPDWIPADMRQTGTHSAGAARSMGKMAIAIAAVCDAAVAIEGMPLLDYRSLPEAAWSKVAPYFGLTVNDDERQRMVALSRFDAKENATLREFEDDTLAKRDRADETLRSLAHRFVEPRLERLKTEHRFL